MQPSETTIIALGRFEREGDEDRTWKVWTPISFGTEQVFKIYGTNPDSPAIEMKKQLVAVVNHIGNAPDMGHYTAYVRDPRTGTWMFYDNDAFLE